MATAAFFDLDRTVLRIDSGMSWMRFQRMRGEISAAMLAKLHRAGELTPVWVPDTAHEAMRDLVRSRATAVRVAGQARRHLQGFLLRHGRICPAKKGWTKACRRWLSTVRFEHPAQQIVFQDYIHARDRRRPCHRPMQAGRPERVP